MKIYFENCNNFFIKHKIKKIYKTAVDVLDIDFIGFSININFVSEEEIQKLNNEFRKVDKVTDVLSFPHYELKKGKNLTLQTFANDINKSEGLICLGDIAICLNQAKKQAKEYSHSLKREICFLALHGFLHIMGYDHLTEEDEQEMQEIAEKVLQKNKVKRNV